MRSSGRSIERTSRKDSPFHVPWFLHVLGGLVEHYRDFFLWLAGLESSLLTEEIRRVAITMPIYVAGLARSGTTLLHEVVSSHPGVATHRMKDYPMLFTPYWWRQATAKLRPGAGRERAHQDRIIITNDSPDALEEMLWMAFFPHCHDVSVSNILTAGVRYPSFEAFYRAHMAKLLVAEQSTRYVAKANYHVARLGYLARLLPDARFLIPVRAPVSHIASLLRQQQLFSAGQRQQPRALAFMQRTGHFEFGLDRRPMHLGDPDRVGQIVQAWAIGDDVRGFAAYWDMVYGYLARLLAADAQLRTAAMVIPFESLCRKPADTLHAALAHCMLPDAGGLVERYAPNIRLPNYYRSALSRRDLDVIRQETRRTAGLWGYDET